MSHPSDLIMGATGTPTCAPPNAERLEVDSKSFTPSLGKDMLLHHCCFMLFQGGKTGPGKDLGPRGSGIGKREGQSATVTFTCSSGQLSAYSSRET